MHTNADIQTIQQLPDSPTFVLIIFVIFLACIANFLENIFKNHYE